MSNGKPPEPTDPKTEDGDAKIPSGVSAEAPVEGDDDIPPREPGSPEG